MCIEDLKSDPNPPKFTVLVIVQDHAEQLKCSEQDTKSNGYKRVYVCSVSPSTDNAMYAQIESFHHNLINI